MRIAFLTMVASLLLAVACSDGDEARTAAATTTSTEDPATDPTEDSSTQPNGPSVEEIPPPVPTTTRAMLDRTVGVDVRIVRATADAATEGFEASVREVLLDERGWVRAGFRITFDDAAPYSVELLEPDDAHEACQPYNVRREFSCQIGPRVILNAARWRSATESWPGTVEEYRTMLVNHEVGHLLGQHHPPRICASSGMRAAVMAQQSKGLAGCLASSWPLDWEIRCAARHEEQLAPGYEPDAAPSCREDDQ